MQHTFHKENCASKVRKQFKTVNKTITLVGKHAFEWSIVTENHQNNTYSATKYPNRVIAEREYKLLKDSCTC